MRCPNCDNELPPNARFCGRCGVPVAAAPAPRRRKSGWVWWLLLGLMGVLLGYGGAWLWQRGGQQTEAAPTPAIVAPRLQATSTPRVTATPQFTATPQSTATATIVPTPTPLAAEPIWAEVEQGGAAIKLNLSYEPSSIDPALADWQGRQMTELLFLGLTDYDDRTSEVVPELATAWSVSDDGLVWTFTLRQDVFWVRYDPKLDQVERLGPVTAHDVVYGVVRSLKPATHATDIHNDWIIKNAAALGNGQSSDFNSLGVRALDDFTVAFTLEEPASYFPGMAGMWFNRAQPSEAIERFGNGWTEPGQLISNGPYVLTDWQHEQGMTMAKNPFYFDAQEVQINRINWVIISEYLTALAMYENGELDVTSVLPYDAQRIAAAPTLSAEFGVAAGLCTYYLGFNSTQAPLNDVLVRQALSASIDREQLMGIPAKSLASPALFGSAARDPEFIGAAFDPARARQLLADAGHPGGKGLAPITLLTNESQSGEEMAASIIEGWQKELGIAVDLEILPWNEFNSRLDNDRPQVFVRGQCAAFPDAYDILESLHPRNGFGDPIWAISSPGSSRYGAMLDSAATKTDSFERRGLLEQADQVLVMNEAVIAPLFYSPHFSLTKPYVQRTFSPWGAEHIDQWRIER